MPSAFDLVSSFADNPSAFLALNSGNEFFLDGRHDGVCAFRPAGRHLLQLGGPFAAPGDRAGLLDAFLDRAASGRRRVIAVQLQADDARLYASRGFTVNQMGASYAVDLARFTLRGSPFVRLRNKISRARRAGVEVTEVGPSNPSDASGAPNVSGELDLIDAEWLRGKGKGTKELRFLVGERDGPEQKHQRVFTGTVDGRIVGYICYSPAFGSRPGWLHDLSRRRADAPPGTMELLNSTAIERITGECRDQWLHFGFTPFVGLDPALEVPGASGTVARVVRFLGEHGERVYPAAAQLDYKEKWAPHVVLPEYIAFQGRVRPGALWRLGRETNAF
ncbi:bifunctional lysylphosphatidylglycerol flippase/synthetase MprF [Streptomyces sp. B21-083]|uniref:bifunctional lysylphosphatidylglycerol flippase/synthetase MprF n=1 Tax=Streptomyces sp. B21-083 TaxID=3039410 RepID=UPI002FF1F823